MNIRDTYNAWQDVPPWLQAAVEAYDAARRAGGSEPAMSERNKCSIAPMIEQAVNAVVPEPGLRRALNDLAIERRRQIEVEGRGPYHDDQYALGQLALAAAAYAAYSAGAIDGTGSVMDAAMRLWPWPWTFWKPKDHRRNLVRAGALVVAEIERFDRANAPPEGGE